TTLSDAEREVQEKELLAFVALGHELGVRLVRIFGGRVEDGDLPAAVERVAASLQRLAPEAERAGVTIAIETHDDFSRSATVAEVALPHELARMKEWTSDLV